MNHIKDLPQTRNGKGSRLTPGSIYHLPYAETVKLYNPEWKVKYSMYTHTHCISPEGIRNSATLTD